MKDMKMEKDKSWGMVGLSRCYGDSKELFGSDITNYTFIELTIKHAQKSRSLGRDFTMGDDIICKVQLSPNQFADLLTNMNVGDGVPCTIKFTQKDGVVEYKPEPRKLEIIEKEREQKTDDIVKTTKDILIELKTLLDNNKIPKTQGREIWNKLDGICTYLENGGSEFLRKQAREEISNMVVEAKSQVSSYVDSKIYSVGLETLLNSSDIKPKLLTDKKE